MAFAGRGQRAGYLHKRGGGTTLLGSHKTRKRFFVLGGDGSLAYFKDADDYAKHGTAAALKGAHYNLKECTVAVCDGENATIDGKPCVAIVVSPSSARGGPHDLVLLCETPAERELWFEAMGHATRRASADTPLIAAAAAAAAAEAGKDGTNDLSGGEHAHLHAGKDGGLTTMGKAALTRDLLEEINLCRADPKAYAAHLEAHLAEYDASGLRLVPTDGGHPIHTQEGVAAVRAAIAHLRALPPAPPLSRRAGIDQASLDHATDLGTIGADGTVAKLDHIGTDGTNPPERLGRYGVWHKAMGEALTSRALSARSMTIQMLVGDGDAKRQYRQLILDPNMLVCGCATSTHPTLGVVSVVDLADGFAASPLDAPAKVACAGHCAPSPGFVRVRDSVPLEAMHRRVDAALEDGRDVELDYAPGRCEVTYRPRRNAVGGGSSERRGSTGGMLAFARGAVAAVGALGVAHDKEHSEVIEWERAPPQVASTILAELNACRRDPKAYADTMLRPLLERYSQCPVFVCLSVFVSFSFVSLSHIWPCGSGVVAIFF